MKVPDWSPYAVYDKSKSRPVLKGLKKGTPEHIVKAFKTDYLSSVDSIAKRCPNGKWLDPEDNKCIPKEEWEAKYGKKEKNPNPKKYAPRCDKRTHLKLRQDCPGLGKKGECVSRKDYSEWYNKKGGKEYLAEESKRKSEERSEQMKQRWEEKRKADKPQLEVTIDSSLESVNMPDYCKKALSYNVDKSKDLFDKFTKRNGYNTNPYSKSQHYLERIEKHKDRVKSIGTLTYLRDYVDVNIGWGRGQNEFEAITPNQRKGLSDGMEFMYRVAPMVSASFEQITCIMRTPEGNPTSSTGYFCAELGVLNVNPIYSGKYGVTYNNDSKAVKHFFPDEKKVLATYGRGYMLSTYPDKCTNPQGGKDTIAFHFPPSETEGLSSDDWEALGMQQVVAHEMGHSMGYQLAFALNYRNRMEIAWFALFDKEMPKDMDLETAFKKMKAKAKKREIQNYIDWGMSEGQAKGRANESFKYEKLDNQYNKVLPSIRIDPHKQDDADELLRDAFKEIESVYKELYGISDEDFNPLDVYSEYGLYGTAGMLGLDEYREATNYSDYTHERIAEAYADVAIRGDKANSMSTLIVAYVNYTINQVYSGSSKDFRTFVKESMSESERKKLRENRIIKFIY